MRFGTLPAARAPNSARAAIADRSRSQRPHAREPTHHFATYASSLMDCMMVRLAGVPAPGRAQAGMLETPMSLFRARVRNGRLVLDEPTELPEGSVVDLVPADSADDVPVTEKQKAELDRRIEEMDRDGKRGIPWDEVLDRIRGRTK